MTQSRIDDNTRKFKFIRVLNHVYYWSMKRDISSSETVFVLIEIDLDHIDTWREVKELEQVFPDQNGQMALQMFFVWRETLKRYRDPNVEKARNENDRIKHLKRQVVGVKYAPVITQDTFAPENIDKPF